MQIKMFIPILLCLIFSLAGCGEPRSNRLIRVQIVGTYTILGESSKHFLMIVEREDTHERFRVRPLMGKVGDTFSIREYILEEARNQ